MTEELIAALEKATGDSADLMREAWLAINPEPPIWGDGAWRTWWTKKHCFRAMLDAEAYESAALTLVPEGMRCRFVIYEDGRAGAQLWWPTEALPDAWGKAYPTPALAIVIASLRAHNHAGQLNSEWR